jgi:hypothetical protein
MMLMPNCKSANKQIFECSLGSGSRLELANKQIFDLGAQLQNREDRLKTLDGQRERRPTQLESASKKVDEIAAQLQSSEDRCKGSEIQLE